MSTKPERMTAAQYNAIRGVARGNVSDALPSSSLASLGGGPQSEAELVQEIRKAFAAIGYEVAGIGQHRAKGSGTAVGFPDLAIRRQGWARGVWMLIETKTAGGKLSPAQAELEARGGSFLCRGVASVADALLTVETETVYRARLLALLE